MGLVRIKMALQGTTVTFHNGYPPDKLPSCQRFTHYPLQPLDVELQQLDVQLLATANIKLGSKLLLQCHSTMKTPSEVADHNGGTGQTVLPQRGKRKQDSSAALQQAAVGTERTSRSSKQCSTSETATCPIWCVTSQGVKVGCIHDANILDAMTKVVRHYVSQGDITDQAIAGTSPENGVNHERMGTRLSHEVKEQGSLSSQGGNGGLMGMEAGGGWSLDLAHWVASVKSKKYTSGRQGQGDSCISSSNSKLEPPRIGGVTVRLKYMAG